jgi:hypothetical protein
MRYFVLLLTFLLSWPSSGYAQECGQDSECVLQEDLEVLLSSVEEKQCLMTTPPRLTLDSITITTDEQGRVYYSGSAPVPFGARLSWCNHEVQFEGKLKVVVAKREPKEWGFRFKLKFAGSFLFLDAFERSAQQAVDVGLLWDFLYWRSLNLNVATGFRSAGVGVGYDITKNFGVYTGYGFSFWTLKSNPQMGLYFGFW